MENTHYPYRIWIQEALYSVIKRAIEVTIKNGSTSEHALYITFKTNAEGVQLSEKIKKEYPTQMTIVLEHEYGDLTLTETGFSVDLSFGVATEVIIVPWKSILSFSDPTASMMLDVSISSDMNNQDESLPKEGKIIKFPRKD